MKISDFYKSDMLLLVLVIFIVITLCFGFGYFAGRYEQIQLNRSILQPIPDVNCGYTK